jgi:hypothetical protein
MEVKINAKNNVDGFTSEFTGNSQTLKFNVKCKNSK